MGDIHPTAIVAPQARIAADARIGPYCVIGPEVVLGAAVELKAHVVIEGHTQIGEETFVHQFAALGGPPQHLRYAGEPTELWIGRNCCTREYVTINRGTAMGGGRTTVGEGGFFMPASISPMTAMWA
jgi:UDP-N-acetylglucosamine acyltransferase